MDGRVGAREYRSQGAISWQYPRTRGNGHGAALLDEPPGVRRLIGPDPERTPVSAVMSRRIVSVPPETSVEGVTALLLGRGLRAALVIGTDGGLCGVVSTSDLLREVQDRGDVVEQDDIDLGGGFHEHSIARATVEEIMTPFAYTIPETASIARAAALMACEGIHQLPVIAASGDRMVGVLGVLDVMRWLGRATASS